MYTEEWPQCSHLFWAKAKSTGVPCAKIALFSGESGGQYGVEHDGLDPLVLGDRAIVHDEVEPVEKR
jgi:hypothetical protein